MSLPLPGWKGALRAAGMNLLALLLVVGVGEAAVRLLQRQEDPALTGPRIDTAPGARFRWFSKGLGPDGKREYDVEVVINRYGFPGPDHPPRRAPGAKRVAFIGDSFVEAYHVEREVSFPARLEALLPGTEVLNFARQGYSTTRQARLLEILASSLRDGEGPDLPEIVLFNCHAHFALSQALADTVHRPALWRRGSLAIAQRARTPSLLLEICRRSMIARLAEGDRAVLAEADRCFEPGYRSDELEAAWAVVGGAMRDLAERSRALGMRPVFFHLPSPRELRGPGPTLDPSAPARRMASLAKEAGAPWIDLVGEFRTAKLTGGGPLHFPVDSHLTPRGHAVAAEGLARAIRPLLDGRDPPR